jgi:glycosyltransferase involved in cell wall biosynthesis
LKYIRQIAIIVPTYNRPDALARVLEGLSLQSRPPDEIIIADDGSGNETRHLAETFIKKSSVPMIHIWQKDQGFRLAAIRNKAVRACRSDYIVFLDGDCIPERFFVEDHCRLARPGYFVQGKRILVDKAMSAQFSFNSINCNRIRLLLSRHIANKHHLLRLPWFPAFSSNGLSGTRGCNMGFFKTDLFAINGFNEDFKGWGREDSELVIRLYKYGLKRRGHSFAAICYHLWHPDNTPNKCANDDLLAETIACKEHICRKGLFTKEQ